ncbi:MAG: MBL fold metallo-hydrolase [Thermoplasmata archaeon]|nr:MBL fold metallo-hydrolase [Thermoplasmata archaeon]
MKVHYIAGVAYDSNVYLLEDDDPIIVDTGTGMSAGSTLGELSKIVPLEDIGRIVLTHSHYDHIGGAEAMCEATGAKLYLHEAEADPMRAGDMSLTASRMFGKAIGKMDVEPLREGQELRCGSSVLEVLHTPGHSPGSLALFDGESRSAIVGDTVFCDGGVGRWDLPGGDLRKLKSSLERLKTLGLKNMYPGHGSYAEGDAEYHLRLSAEYLERAY